MSTTMAEPDTTVDPGRGADLPDGVNWLVAVALARVEGLRVLRHPVWWLGVAVSGWFMWGEWAWRLGHLLVPTDWMVARLANMATPLAMATLVVAHVAMGRLERDAVEDVATATSSSVVTRRLGVLLAQLVPALAALVLAAATTAWLSLQAPGGIGIADLLHVPAWILLGGVLGVVVARLSTAIVMGPLAVVVVVATNTVLVNDSSIRQRLAPVHDWIPDAAWPGMLPRNAWVHLAWVLALVVIAGVVAVVARRLHRRDMVRAITTGVVAVGVAGGAIVVLQGSLDPATADRVHSLLDAPAATSTCDAVVEPVTWCTPIDGTAAVREVVRGDVRTAMDLLPPDTEMAPTTMQVHGLLTQAEGPIGVDLGLVAPDEVLRAGRLDRAGDGVIRVRPSESRRELVRAILANSWLEISSPAGGDDSDAIVIGEEGSTASSAGECSLRGQARGALLVAVTDLASGYDEPLPELIVEGDESSLSYGVTGEFYEQVHVPGGRAVTTWEQTQVAHHLASRGSSAIEALHDDWDRWSDPATGLDELVAVSGAPTPSSVEESVRAAHERSGIPIPEGGVTDFGAEARPDSPACR